VIMVRPNEKYQSLIGSQAGWGHSGPYSCLAGDNALPELDSRVLRKGLEAPCIQDRSACCTSLLSVTTPATTSL
jgi:hypothetical protein